MPRLYIGALKVSKENFYGKLPEQTKYYIKIIIIKNIIQRSLLLW